MAYDWNFQAFLPYAAALGRGVVVSLELTAIASVVGTVAGAGLAIPLRWPGVGPVLGAINDALRAIPLIVLLFAFYYFPAHELFGLPPPSAFWAAAAALTLAQANFTAEVVRGAIDGVPEGLVMGARALGLREPAIWLHVVGPQVVRQILPTMIAFYIGNLKLSSLASIIGAEDVVYVARLAVSQTFRSLEAWVLVAGVYVVLVVPCTMLARSVEQSRWMSRR